MVKNMNMKKLDLEVEERIRRTANKHYLVFTTEELEIVKKALGYSTNKALAKVIAQTVSYTHLTLPTN